MIDKLPQPAVIHETTAGQVREEEEAWAGKRLVLVRTDRGNLWYLEDIPQPGPEAGEEEPEAGADRDLSQEDSGKPEEEAPGTQAPDPETGSEPEAGEDPGTGEAPKPDPEVPECGPDAEPVPPQPEEPQSPGMEQPPESAEQDPVSEAPAEPGPEDTDPVRPLRPFPSGPAEPDRPETPAPEPAEEAAPEPVVGIEAESPVRQEPVRQVFMPGPSEPVAAPAAAEDMTARQMLPDSIRGQGEGTRELQAAGPAAPAQTVSDQESLRVRTGGLLYDWTPEEGLQVLREAQAAKAPRLMMQDTEDALVLRLESGETILSAVVDGKDVIVERDDQDRSCIILEKGGGLRTVQALTASGTMLEQQVGTGRVFDWTSLWPAIFVPFAWLARRRHG